MLEERLKAPEGKFAVCVWDPSNPSKSIPYIVSTKGGKEAIYDSEKYASWYAGLRNNMWKERLSKMNERQQLWTKLYDYFVIDDKGLRVC